MSRGRAWTVGMRMLAPGVYCDREGAIHLSIPELCKVFKLPNTPENAARVEKLALEAIAEGLGRTLPIERREHPDA